jgi:hypothetical protein
VAAKVRLIHAEVTASALARVRLIHVEAAASSTAAHSKVRLIHAEVRSTVAGSKVRLIHAEVRASLASTLKVFDGTSILDGQMMAWDGTTIASSTGS